MARTTAKRSVADQFGGEVRVRVGGILIVDNKILLLKHQGVGPAEYLWSPPGGGLEFGSNVTENLKREFKEEVNLEIEVGPLLFVNEFIQPPIHAIELFHEVKLISGITQLGRDPEMGDSQILTDFAYFSEEDLKKEQKNRLHNMFHIINKPQEVLNLKGYYKFVINSV